MYFKVNFPFNEQDSFSCTAIQQRQFKDAESTASQQNIYIFFYPSCEFEVQTEHKTKRVGTAK